LQAVRSVFSDQKRLSVVELSQTLSVRLIEQALLHTIGLDPMVPIGIAVCLHGPADGPPEDDVQPDG
jgi:hypothetical protein